MIHLQETTDYDLYKSILVDPEMWDRIHEDGEESKDMDDGGIPEGWHVIAAQTQDGLMGCFTVHSLPQNMNTWELHVNVLEPFREKYSSEFGREMMKWMSEELPVNVEWVKAQIPEIYPDVLRFAEKLGFRDFGEGRIFRKNGEDVTQRLVMVSRQELKRWV